MPRALPFSLSHSNGEWAIQLVGRQAKRLAALQGDALHDRDPEALHQMRVNLRRLRTTLQQFSPALVLPPAVRDQRLAQLQQWLHEWLLPPTLHLALHPGWWARDPVNEADTLHDPRKRIKNLRYQLENLRSIGSQKLGARINQLRNLQELLGELNDLAAPGGAAAWRPDPKAAAA
jgi:CHAD domain-containing protein